MKHKGTVLLETERLLLRRFEISDSKDMYNNWASDEEVVKYLTWKKYKNVEVAEETISSWIKNYDKDDFYQYAIVLKSTNDLVGSICAIPYTEKEAAYLGYCIGKKWWGQGIVVEACKKLFEYLFLEVGFNRIAAICDVENISSEKVMKKLGMKYEGTLRQNGISNKGIYDEVYYSILKNEYLS